jgi:hypothetical protein
MEHNIKIQQGVGMEIVLNGGKSEMDAATIPIRWFFSPEVAAKKPTYIIIVEQNNEEIENDTFCAKSRRYLCEVSEVVKFIQLFNPGLHRVGVLAFAGDNAKSEAEDFMVISHSRYTTSVLLGNIESGAWQPNMNEEKRNDNEYDDDFDPKPQGYPAVVVAATVARFSVPAELFAKPPETKIGKMIWKYVNTFFDEKPQDECAYRKRKIFAFTIQPILFLLYYVLRYLFAGTLYATYVLLASIVVWFFGFQPTPILKNMGLAFLCKDRSYRKHGRWYSQWSVLEHHNYRKIINYDKNTEWNYTRKRIVPFHLAMLLILVVGSVYSLISYWEIILPYLFKSLAILLLVSSVGYLLIRLSVVLVKWSKNQISEKKVYKVIRKNKVAKEKQLAEIDWQQKYQLWLENNLTLANKPSSVDLKKIPKPLLKADRTVQHFRISFWSLKIKVCRPFSN